MTLVERAMPEEVERRYEGVAGLAAYRILKVRGSTTRQVSLSVMEAYSDLV